MAKKLTLVDIKKSNSKYTELTRVDLNEDTYVNIYKNFSPVKLSELIKELLTDPTRAEKAGIDFEAINTTDWGLFNLIYKFTDLGIPSDIGKKVQAFHTLVEYEYFGKIIESFPQESIDLFAEKLKQFSANLDLINEKLEVENGVVEEAIDNKEFDDAIVFEEK